MKFLMMIFVLVFHQFSYTQTQVPDLIIPITVTFDIPPYPPPYPGVEYLQIGLDSTATDGVDIHLGEGAIPPIPPPGPPAFFRLPDGLTSVYEDFRFGELPYTGTKIHRLLFCSECGATIYWALPEGATGQLTDLVGGIFVNVPMIGSGSYYVSNFNIGHLRMTINYVNVVPVELISFSANVVNNKIELNWSTATETNNSGFEIQRLEDYKIEKLNDLPTGQAGWETIGFVPGYGTTTEPKSYSFIDKDVTSGSYKYRLKQIDFDGSFTYSNEVEVVVDLTPKEFVLYQNYPNPFNPNTVISYQLPMTGYVTLKVYDVLGKEVATLVNEEKQAGVYEVEFFAKELASGIYFYQIKAGGYTEINKMILLR